MSEILQEIFTSTDLDIRLQVLLEIGKEILTINKPNKFIKIYQIDDFYVELIYKNELKKITYINLIDPQEFLEKYNNYNLLNKLMN
ncbi:MAG: hypothetical protein WBL11_03065 [Bacteroidales bacterium]|jgi:hypothetical protein|nr:hypothetical protein [Bacteroidales bacterium]MDI9575415.1 hypothetical protein [Bacteroidota bacterium]MDY0400209.1 hypothetical protein [Bacteroidales bacterium]HHW59972.1 hypothetical protein [Bacteroidales bacterium]HOB78276.1 hypothetical protein [Bacteroidales bacterium]